VPTEEQQEEEKEGGFADNEETGGGDAPRVAIGFSAYPPRGVESFGGAPPDDVDEDAEAGIVVSAATVAQNNHYRAASAPGLPLASPAACDGASREAPLLVTPIAGAGANAAVVAAAGSAPAPTAGDGAGVPAPARRGGIPLRLDAHASVPAPAVARGLQAPEVSPSAESELLVFDQAPAVFTSTLPRTIQTVAQLPFPSQQLSALNPMETGICLGVPLQYLPSQFPDEYARWATAPNRATHRITGGESLTDVVQRLTPFVIEMERCRRPVLVCSHLSTLQVLLAYFKGARWACVCVRARACVRVRILCFCCTRASLFAAAPPSRDCARAACDAPTPAPSNARARPSAHGRMQASLWRRRQTSRSP